MVSVIRVFLFHICNLDNSNNNNNIYLKSNIQKSSIDLKIDRIKMIIYNYNNLKTIRNETK